MIVEIKEIGPWQNLILRAQNNVEKTILNNLVNQLPHAKTRGSCDNIYVSEAEYGLTGLIKIVLTNTTPVTRW